MQDDPVFAHRPDLLTDPIQSHQRGNTLIGGNGPRISIPVIDPQVTLVGCGPPDVVAGVDPEQSREIAEVTAVDEIPLMSIPMEYRAAAAGAGDVVGGAAGDGH